MNNAFTWLAVAAALLLAAPHSGAQGAPAAPAPPAQAKASAVSAAPTPAPDANTASQPASAAAPANLLAPEPTQVIQLVQGNVLRRNYPDGLTALLAELNKETTLPLDPDPLYIETFDDPRIFEHPFIYVNYADRSDWTLSEAEKEALRAYLDRGGFIYIDAGITPSFLRDSAQYGQSHSFAEWRVTPELEEAFSSIYPDKAFLPLPRSHPLFRAFYSGLPDASVLPDTVRDYVVNEKWPQGTYAAMGLTVNGRLAVLAMPILAMGWGKNDFGQWTTFIGFRIREGAEGLSERLSEAAYTGTSYEVTREDGRKDQIFTQEEAMPAWVHEPDGDWRVFRYYYTQEISDYAHSFYTQLGVNIFVYAYTQ
ncbi:DUF4159 domain-containing protein [Ruficoccus amylovorans]|uniref:DUF4159 domain-containing protein n=1 Tax=Ruficoccus amylovorans TaxID=1804625 RepID=A0A842HK77_9BACT|nr:DUF4159 domain-containing protein [Ruficoccus amylovorans]MBC2595561.1 DUF4159 domain-containing protein [Ruficoccus amylovorans]